jgi:hypothetical protein
MLAESKKRPRKAAAHHVDGITAHVDWLNRHWKTTIAEVIVMKAVDEQESDALSMLNGERMVAAIEKELTWHTEHLACEEMALAGNRNHEALEAHKHLGCSPLCSFWYIMRKRKRPRKYNVKFFSTDTSDFLWPGIIYN